MNDNLVSAVFDNHSEAEIAARELRQAGVPLFQITHAADNVTALFADHDRVVATPLREAKTILAT